MRSKIAAIVVLAAGAANAATEMTQEQRTTHALHGLMHMYAAGTVCFYSKWSFSKQDIDEMLPKIKELSKSVPQKTADEMWSEGRAIMAEGQASATQDRCEKVHQQYVIGRPFIFGIKQPETTKPPP